MAMKPYFITGTDTHCGKTYVTLALLHWLQKEKQKVHAIKPVASGFMEQKPINEDVLAIKTHTAFKDLPVSLYDFADPIAPHLAARRAEKEIKLKELMDFCQQPLFNALDHLFIEGAGGLLVPLNEKETWLDFLHHFKIPVILVVGLRLGCINHALLTASVLKASNIPCLGWIANKLDVTMNAQEENVETLRAWLELPLLGTVSHQGAFSVFSKIFV